MILRQSPQNMFLLGEGHAAGAQAQGCNLSRPAGREEDDSQLSSTRGRGMFWPL